MPVTVESQQQGVSDCLFSTSSFICLMITDRQSYTALGQYISLVVTARACRATVRCSRSALVFKFRIASTLVLSLNSWCAPTGTGGLHEITRIHGQEAQQEKGRVCDVRRGTCKECCIDPARAWPLRPSLCSAQFKGLGGGYISRLFVHIVLASFCRRMPAAWKHLPHQIMVLDHFLRMDFGVVVGRSFLFGYKFK